MTPKVNALPKALQLLLFHSDVHCDPWHTIRKGALMPTLLPLTSAKWIILSFLLLGIRNSYIASSHIVLFGHHIMYSS